MTRDMMRQAVDEPVSNDAKVWVRMTNEMHEALQASARAAERTVAGEVRLAVAAWLRVQG